MLTASYLGIDMLLGGARDSADARGNPRLRRTSKMHIKLM
jgi:hypothetical protein